MSMKQTEMTIVKPTKGQINIDGYASNIVTLINARTDNGFLSRLIVSGIYILTNRVNMTIKNPLSEDDKLKLGAESIWKAAEENN